MNKNIIKEKSSQLLLMLLFFVTACQQDADPTVPNKFAETALLNPYLTISSESSNGRVNPYNEPVEGGIAQNLGPVITPAGGFMVNSNDRFEEGDEFFVDVAISENKSLVFFISGTNLVAGHGNDENVCPESVIEAFVNEGVVYVWGYRHDREFTWTIAFRQRGINHLDMREGHIGKPEILTTTITKYLPETTLTNSPSMTFEFISNDADATFECTLDDGTPAPCTSPKTYNELGDGQHTFQVHALRGANRNETGSTHTWEVDLTPPANTLPVITAAETSIHIQWSTSEPATSGIYWGVTSEAPENQVPESATYLEHHEVLLGDLTPGTLYYFVIYGKDLAGNTFHSETFSSVTSLTTTITARSPEEALTNKISMTLAFSSNDPEAGFECSLNNASPTPCTSPQQYIGLADGSYTFHVWAVNGSQRDETGATSSWRVDTVPAFITMISTVTTRNTLQIDWTTSEPTTAYIEWGLNSVSPENLIPESAEYLTSRTLIIGGLTPATVYYFIIGGRDEAGNIYRSSRFSSATRR